MHKIDSSGNVSGQWSAGNPQEGQQATVIDAAWMNAVQGELVSVIEAAGITLVKGTNDQLLSALLALSVRLTGTNVWTAKNTFNVDGDGWQTLPLNTGWVVANGGVNARTPQYRVDSFGRVWLRGEAAATTSPAPTRVALLPAAVAPPNFRGGFWRVVSDTTASGSTKLQIGGATASGLITPGEIQCPEQPAHVCFDGVEFYINGK